MRVLLLALAIVLVSCNSKGIDKTTTTSPATKEFSVTILNRQYTPAQIDVQKGDRVVLHVTNQDSSTHAINIPTFGVRSSVGAGQTQTIEFVASQPIPAQPLCGHGEILFINVQG